MKHPAAAAAVLLAGLSACRPAARPSDLAATADDPIFATYAAATERSSFLLDEGYAWVLHDKTRGARFTTDSAGDLGIRVAVNGERAPDAGRADAPVRVSESYADIVRYGWTAGSDIDVEAQFTVYNSRSAVWDLTLTNDGLQPAVVVANPYLAPPAAGWIDTLPVAAPDSAAPVGYYAEHVEAPDNWMVNHDMPHVSDVANFFAAFGEDTWAPTADDVESPDTLFLESTHVLEPGASFTLRVMRIVEPTQRGDDGSPEPRRLIASVDALSRVDVGPALQANRTWLKTLALDRFASRDDRLLYLSAANLMRQVFYPPEARSSYRWYVFSREPTWGWGHGGQVFHESLTMFALAAFDPLLAFESQYVYEERQHGNGYINYRTGAHLDEVILHNDTLTSSAPWYAYINAELYGMTAHPSVDGSVVDEAARDEFLRRMYDSSRRFYEYYVTNRDRDGDGLAEWGGHAVLESVRDGYVAVWDEVGWPTNFDAVDVNAMLVKEERSLAYMAGALGLREEADAWRERADRRAALINEHMWDETTGFYYNVDRRDNDFTFARPDDLKRREIIGFLPLWAGVADSAQAARLVEHLTNPASFWRRNGVPTLAADDPYYNPRGYWNGPIWVQWNYLIWRGLRDYGYEAEADELLARVKGVMLERLRAEHNLFELYDPDASWGGFHQPYIWAGIVNAMLDDRYSRRE